MVLILHTGNLHSV